MANQNFDYSLTRLLKKEVLKEKWRKKWRLTGKVIGKRITKKGSFMFKIKAKKLEYNIVIPKHRKNEFELAKNIYEGDVIKVTGDKHIGVIFCNRIKKMNKVTLNEKQTKLLAYMEQGFLEKNIGGI